MSHEIITLVTGDDNAPQIACIKNGKPLVISMGAIVRAQFNSAESGISVGPVTCNSGWPGANWPAGVVTVEFPALLSETLPLGSGEIEIEINDGGKLQTYFARHIEVKEGKLD